MKCILLAALCAATAAHAFSSHSPVALDHTKRFDKVLRTAPEVDIVERDGRLAERDGPDKMGLAKRATNGRMSFFAPGLGACGSYSNAGDFMVAMNAEQYGSLGRISDWCFQTITITYGGRSHTATVLDACPGCPYGGLDMSPALFNYFADSSVGIIYASWTSGNNNPQPSTSKWVAPSTTTSRWVAPTTRSTSQWVEPTTSSSTTSTTTRSSTTSSTTTSSSSSSSSSSTTSLSSNGTRNATASAVLPGASSSVVVSELAGGNLDNLVQVVLALGSLAGAAAQAESS